MVRGLFAFGLVLAQPLLTMAKERAVSVTKIDGTQISGELIAWNVLELTVQTENESVTIASPHLLRVRWQHEGPREASEELLLELVDGTWLSHHSYAVQRGEATIVTPLAEQPMTLSTDRVAFVQLATDFPGRERVSQDLDGDLLVVRKKKAGAFDHLSGILGDVSPEQVKFTWEGEAIPVKRSKVAALAYFHAQLPTVKKPVCWLNLRDGVRLPVVDISYQQQEVRVRTSGGLALSFALELLQDADYSQGKLVYLSDLQPIEQNWTPRIGLPTSATLILRHGLPRRDQSFTGSAIALRWPPAKSASIDGALKTYDKGLAIRSRTEIRYRVPKGMRRFVTLAGIDPETANQGNVTLEIFADRRSIWQGEIEGSSAPTAIDVALDDARELRIVVDYGKNLDFGDRLHLAEARLSQ